MAASVLSRGTTTSLRSLGDAQLLIALVVLLALTLPLLSASRGALTSDESLYVSEGLNIADGKGYTYTTGEPVNHRGPLFPAVIAADFKIAGASVDNALWVPRLFALSSAALLIVLGWRFFGREAGLLAGALVLGSALLSLMSASLFLDTAESFFLLLTLLLLHKALMWGRVRWSAAAGAALGLAFLTKESALLWLPLPFLALLLLGPAAERPRDMLLAFGAGFLAVAGWWWPYVFAATGHVYLLGEGPAAFLWLGAGAMGVALAARVSVAGVVRSSLRQHERWLIAGAVLLLWGAFFLVGLERHSTWSYSTNYFSTVPDYVTTTMASWLRPLPLIAAAWGYVAYRASRGSMGDRLLLLGLALFMPFVVFVANRDLHIRDILPAVYLSYLALARAAVDFARWFAQAAGEAIRPAFGGAAAALVVLAGVAWFVMAEGDRFSDAQNDFHPSVVRQDNWDNLLVHNAAGWLEDNVEPGTHIMSSRLYYSHLYTLTGAEYPTWQLPTVRLDFEGDAHTPVRGSTLFRWEDHDMPAGPAEPWLYIQRYPAKGYYVGLSERDLLADLREHEIDYLVISGNDAGFSTLSILPYFEDHPAFTEVASFVADGANQVHIFRVVRDLLVPVAQPARVSADTVDAIRERFGLAQGNTVLESLSSEGYVLSGH